MLLDVTEEKIYAYPYKEFNKELNVGGRTSLTKQYDEALRGDQLVIFIRDRQNKKLISYSLGRPSVQQSYRIERIETGCHECIPQCRRRHATALSDTPTWWGAEVYRPKGSNDHHGIGTDAKRRDRGRPHDRAEVDPE
jgi:hypothetical protein